MRPAIARQVLATLSLTTVAGCTSAASDAAPALEQWTIAPTPVVHIGTTVAIRGASDPHTEFSSIHGVVRMPAGNIVVADGDSRELRVFAPDGHFVRVLSRQGDGPGEFRSISFIVRERDTILAFDGAAGRVSRFTVDSGFISRASLAETHGLPVGSYIVSDRLSDRALLVHPGIVPRFVPTLNTVTRASVAIGILRPASYGKVTWLGPFPGTSVVGYKDPKVPGGIGDGLYLYGPQTFYAASGNRIWIGDSGNRDIVLYNALGAPVDTATWPDDARELDTDVLDRVKQRTLAESPERASYLEILYDASLRPSRAPYFASFHAGAHGGMWVERFREDPAAPAEFVVFDSTGAPRATVTVPPGVDIREVGDDYIVGVRTDADGVETVAEYRLQRG